MSWNPLHATETFIDAWDGIHVDAPEAQGSRPWLPIEDAARFLSVSKSTLVRRIRDGMVKSVEVAGKVCVPTEEVWRIVAAVKAGKPVLGSNHRPKGLGGRKKAG